MMTLSFRPLFLGGNVARTKLVCLGSAGKHLLSGASSLKNILEHVSLAEQLRPEISRRPDCRSDRAAAGEELALASMRRWFFARKPDAGFVLTDFPATLLQAIVFDEWLDVRGESLDAVLVEKTSDATAASPELLKHFSTQGLLCETHDCNPSTAATEAALAA